MDELQKCLQAVQDAERVWRGEDGSGGGDFEVVGLVFAKLLDGRAGAGGVNHERWVVGGLGGYGQDSGLGGEMGEEAIAGALETRFCVTLESHLKSAVDGEASCALNRVRGQRHDWQCCLREHWNVG